MFNYGNEKKIANLQIPEVMKTGSANVNFLCNFLQLPLSKISLFDAKNIYKQ